MNTSITSSITDGQKKQYTHLVEDAARRAVGLALDKTVAGQDGWQRVLEHGNELREALAELVVAKTRELSLSNQFADEEVESNYGYPSGYQPKGLNEQCNRLRILFPGIGFANQDLLTQIEKGEIQLPPHAEDWFAIPNWVKNPDIFGATYSQAVLKVLDTIRETRDGKFSSYREGQLDEKWLRQSARTQKFWQDLATAQGNPDILIVAAQVGIRHRGRSVRRARKVFLTNEFGLEAFAVGIILLTHPERLQHCNDLWIDCAGDEFNDPDSDVRFDGSPYFGFDYSRVKFDTFYVADAGGGYGSASGLVPQ